MKARSSLRIGMKEVKVEFDEKGEPVLITVIHWDTFKEFIQKLSALK